MRFLDWLWSERQEYTKRAWHRYPHLVTVTTIRFGTKRVEKYITEAPARGWINARMPGVYLNTPLTQSFCLDESGPAVSAAT